MKKLVVLFILTASMFVFFESSGVTAMNDTGLITHELSEEFQNNVFNNLELVTIKEEPVKRAFVCFDIADNGNIAIGSKVPLKGRIVCIYDPFGVFLYGFKFNSYGDFGIEFDDDALNIYLVRSDLVVKINTDGDLIEVSELSNTRDSEAYLQSEVFSTKKVNKDTEYLMKNDKGFFNLFSSDYSQLQITKEGDVSILYDVNSKQLVLDLLVFVLILCIVFAGAISLFREFRITRMRWKLKKQNNPDQSPFDFEYTLEKLKK